jgi:hypothetical protein
MFFIGRDVFLPFLIIKNLDFLFISGKKEKKFSFFLSFFFSKKKKERKNSYFFLNNDISY